MSITPSALNHDNSPWYIKMEKLANFWNKYSNQKGFEIKGNYNAYIVEFVVNGKTGNNPFSIKGRRQVSNVSSGVIPVKGRFSEKFEVKIKSNHIPSRCFLNVRKKNFLSSFVRKSNRNISIGNYSIRFNSKESIALLKESKVLESENFVKLSIDKNGFKMILFEMPKSDEKMNELTKLWEQNYKH